MLGHYRLQLSNRIKVDLEKKFVSVYATYLETYYNVGEEKELTMSYSYKDTVILKRILY